MGKTQQTPSARRARRSGADAPAEPTPDPSGLV